MANFNKVILMGNLTRDVEVRHTQSGTSIGKTGIAVNRRYSTKDGDQKEETCFVDLTFFGKSAETVQRYVGKGSPLHIEGRLQFSTWETDDGQKRSKLDVVVDNFQFMGGREGGAGEAAGEKATAGSGSGSGNVDYADIPF